MTRDIYETDYYRKGGKGMFITWSYFSLLVLVQTLMLPSLSFQGFLPGELISTIAFLWKYISVKYSHSWKMFWWKKQMDKKYNQI